MAMTGYKRARVIAMFLMAIILFAGCITQRPVEIRELSPQRRTTTDLTGKIVLLPPSAPDRSNLTRLGYFTINNDAESNGIAVLYSSAQSEQAVTYMELYDQAGRLVLIQWVEESGVTERAIDLGVLNDKDSEPVGILGIVVVGTPA